jgi:ABC-type transport system substrate-binding protein
MKMRKLLAVLLSVVMLVSLLAACGTSSDSSTSSTSSSSSSDSSTTTSSSDATEDSGDGILTLATTSGLTSLTPFVSNSGRDAWYWKITYEALGYMNSDQELVPWCASEWSTEDNVTYNITIHDNIYDSQGNHITASDIIWFIGEAQAAALKPVFNKLASYEQTGDYTFSMTLSSNMVGVFEFLMEDIWVISQSAYENSKDQFATEAISTACYEITDFTPSSDWTYTLRDDYWGADLDLDEELVGVVPVITNKVIAEASQCAIALETGLVDAQIGAAISTATQLIDNPSFTTLQCDGVQGYQLFFSGYETSAVAEDVKLRQAICYAIDNQGLIDGYAQGYGTLLHDVCPSFFIGYDEDWDSEDYYDYNPEKAKELLAESDYDGSSLIILCSSSFSRIGEIIQSCLLDVGINVEIYSPETALLLAIRFDGSQYDMFINTIGGTYLPDHWSIRYDPNAYSTGDGTSRHDYVLAELLYKTWTVDGYTKENIDEVHDYLKDNAIGYGLFNMNQFTIYSNSVTLENAVIGFSGKIQPYACTWKGI